MNEIILNIYLIINNGIVEEFRAYSYEMEGGDDRKINFLKGRAKEDFPKAISYNKFHKFEKRGMHMQLFEEIFQRFGVPENPLICVTPVVDGEVNSQ
jgi:hypothetical protein